MRNFWSLVKFVEQCIICFFKRRINRQELMRYTPRRDILYKQSKLQINYLAPRKIILLVDLFQELVSLSTAHDHLSGNF